MHIYSISLDTAWREHPKRRYIRANSIEEAIGHVLRQLDQETSTPMAIHYQRIAVEDITRPAPAPPTPTPPLP